MTTTKTVGRPRKAPAPKVTKPETQGVEKATTPARKRLTLADVPLTELVEVQSCFYGKLIYVSKKTGYVIEWNEFGTTQYVPVEELLTMRNTQPTFFSNQWVRIIGENAVDVINFLQLEKYYSKTIGFDSFDDIFNGSPQKIKEIVSSFTDSMKESFARYTYSLMQSGGLDSLKKIEAVETATGFELKE